MESAASARERMQRAITLSYFNRYLRDRGIITEKEYLRLVHLIQAKYPDPSKDK